MTGVVRFLSLKKKLQWDQDPAKVNYSCYTCRHTFAHRMLSGYWNGGVGCSIETLAELMGNTPKIAYDHYGREWGQSYQDPLWAAIGVEAKDTREKTLEESSRFATRKGKRKQPGQARGSGVVKKNKRPLPKRPIGKEKRRAP